VRLVFELLLRPVRVTDQSVLKRADHFGDLALTVPKGRGLVNRTWPTVMMLKRRFEGDE
jgi:hypothetical protein